MTIESTALIRSVPDSFANAIISSSTPRLDVAAARLQHRSYQEQLAKGGYVVQVVPADENCPDCVFVEDTAVIVGGVAVVTRPGAPSRVAEVGPVADILRNRFRLVTIEAPGTIDGGDVFIAGGTLYVGRSRRTNAAGIAQIEEVAREIGLGVVPVTVNDTLHLKSAVLPLDGETVLVTPGGVDEGPLAGLRILYEEAEERYRASALPLSNDELLVTASAPRTAEMLATSGYAVVPIDISELQAADGGLTCLSIIL